MAERQQTLPFGETVEIREDLDTGALSLVRKKRRKIPEPTYTQRIRALNQWKGESNFELVFTAGAQPYHEAEATKSAGRAGLNTAWDSSIGFRDDAEFALKKMFDPELTRFKPVRSIDLVRLMMVERTNIGHKTNFRLQSLQAYLERAIEIMGEARGLSDNTIENLKIYSRQPMLFS